MIQVLIRSFATMIWLLYRGVGEGRGLASSRPSAAAYPTDPGNAYEFRPQGRGAVAVKAPYALPAREKTRKGFE
jgi:hypothetical protein